MTMVRRARKRDCGPSTASGAGDRSKGVIFNASVQYPRHIQELPSWVATKEIEDELRRSEVPFSIVHPTFLLENLLLPYAVYSITNGGVLAYPVSEQHAFAWTSTEDLARLIDHLLQHK